jgi:ubiquinone/menaquinone biosynthesis C-methylase UbiE
MAAALAERYSATVYGIDPSPEMLEVARSRATQQVTVLERGTAESIPFPHGHFERGLM